ncbi:MAG: M48 family metallopeptidase [Candidatus Bathyarchaeia archaeon]
MVILPIDVSEDEVLKRYSEWIYRKELEIRDALQRSASKELDFKNGEGFRNLVEGYAKKISEECGFHFEKIRYRKMKTKWASFGQKKTLTINPLLRYLPQRYVEYIIFHELVHSIERRHNDNFWRMVRERFDNCMEIERDLFAYWFLIQRVERGKGIHV